MKSTRRLNIVLFAANTALIIAAGSWLGCASAPDNTYHEPTEPGLYNIKGWNGVGAWWPNNSDNGSASDIDVDGTIGHTFYLSGPTALAIPTHNWSGTQNIVSGSLPPGLTMGSNGDVTGIPTERGHWIVTLEETNLETNGTTYNGFKQVVRFHITGSGEVNQ